MSLYYSTRFGEFHLSMPDLEKYHNKERTLTLIGTFNDNGECEVKISKRELFKYKLLAKNFLNTFVEVIK